MALLPPKATTLWPILTFMPNMIFWVSESCRVIAVKNLGRISFIYYGVTVLHVTLTSKE